MSELNILVVEDEALIAEDIATICNHHGYNVIETAHSGGEAICALEKYQLDLVLLDINLEDEVDGIDIAEFIVEKKKLPFIYITSYADKDTLERAKKTKPIGFIVKPFIEDQLLSTIEISLHNYAQGQIPGGLDLAQLNSKIISPITEREFAILQHIYSGKTNIQMAGLEYLSINTIKYHIKQLYAKLDVHSRSGLLARLRTLSQKTPS